MSSSVIEGPPVFQSRARTWHEPSSDWPIAQALALSMKSSAGWSLSVTNYPISIGPEYYSENTISRRSSSEIIPSYSPRYACDTSTILLILRVQHAICYLSTCLDFPRQVLGKASNMISKISSRYLERFTTNKNTICAVMLPIQLLRGDEPTVLGNAINFSYLAFLEQYKILGWRRLVP